MRSTTRRRRTFGPQGLVELLYLAGCYDTDLLAPEHLQGSSARLVRDG